MPSPHVTSDLHRDAVVIDGLMICKWDAQIFTEMSEAGITAANCTVAVFPRITDAMLARGWSEDRIRRVLGLNWLRLLQDVW